VILDRSEWKGRPSSVALSVVVSPEAPYAKLQVTTNKPIANHCLRMLNGSPLPRRMSDTDALEMFLSPPDRKSEHLAPTIFGRSPKPGARRRKPEADYKIPNFFFLFFESFFASVSLAATVSTGSV